MMFLANVGLDSKASAKAFGTSYSRLLMGVFIFNKLRDFPIKSFVNFLPVHPCWPIL